MIFLLILACFFISGLTGLIYETLWTRMIVGIIGTSPFSVTIVLTIFMAGLGFGSWLAGRVVDRIKKPATLIRAYGFMELAIGAYCLILPLLLKVFEPVYAALYNRMFDHFLFYNLLTFVGCAIILIFPAACMGATLPVLCRFFVNSLSRVGTNIGRLYGLNTVGAAAGSLLCGFWLISAVGIWGVALIAIVLNAIIGGICVFVGCRSVGKIVFPQYRDDMADTKTSKGTEKGKAAKRAKTDGLTKTMGLTKTAEPTKSEDAVAFPMYLALTVFAISGFCAMAYEVFWTKLLGLLIGPTTYSFTIVLVTFITGLALGGIVWGLAGDRSKNPIALLAGTQIAAALAALFFSQIMGNSQIFFAKLIYEFQDNFFRLQSLQGLLIFGFMFPTTFFLGAAFPLVGRIYTRSAAGAGKSIGYAYAINSIGAVLGSFSAGFILIPFLGKENGIRLVVCLQLVTALLVLIRGFLIRMKTWKMPTVNLSAALAICVVGIVLSVFFPSWDRAMLSIGKYHRFYKPEITRVGWLDALFFWEKHFPELKSEKLLFYGDGIGGFTTVLESTNIMGDVTHSLCNSGKPDASTTRDMDTQTLLAHFAMLFHPKAEDALVIGLGSGITAGEILHYPVKQLDIVEINEQVVEASRFFAAENNNVLDDPRTKLIIQDGRAHLALTKRKYDLITSEPSNPWMSGIAALYTRDFFELVSARLNPGGFFVQWIPAYQMDMESFNLISRTFVSVFPNNLMVTTNPARPSSFLFIGGNEPINLNDAAARQNLKYAQKSSNITLNGVGVFYNLIVSDDIKAIFSDGPINTDNRPLLEYSAPRTMHGIDTSIIHRIGALVGSTLSPKIAAIQKENQSGVDGQIDYAEYFLSFRGDDFMLRYSVNLAAATSEQKERYSRIVDNFCSRTAVYDFSALNDTEMRNRCFMRQESAFLALVNNAADATPQRKSELYEHLGRIYLQNQRTGTAVEYFLMEKELLPDDAITRSNLGIALMSDGRYIKAEEELVTAIRLDPSYANAYANLGQAIAAQGLGRLDEAIKNYREALRLDPASADTCSYLGAALAEQGKFDEARFWFKRALEIDPSNARAQMNLQRLTAMGK